MLVLIDVYPGTTITWMPLWLSNAVRIGMWVAAIYLAYVIVRRSVQDRGAPPIFFWTRTGLFILLVQQAILNAERFNQPLTYETCLSIPAYFCLWKALQPRNRVTA